jgi:hypothetical protein
MVPILLLLLLVGASAMLLVLVGVLLLAVVALLLLGLCRPVVEPDCCLPVVHVAVVCLACVCVSDHLCLLLGLLSLLRRHTVAVGRCHPLRLLPVHLSTVLLLLAVLLLGARC